MCLKIILKVTKNKGFTLSLEDKFFEKPQKEGRGINLTLTGILGLMENFIFCAMMGLLELLTDGPTVGGGRQKCPPP